MFRSNKAQLTRKLLIVSPATLKEMLRKGNVWYIRHYETYFDKVYVAYLIGDPHEPVSCGNTTLISLGTGRGGKVDLILAPYRLYQLAKKLRPTSYLTADLVYSWWTCALIKNLLRAKIYLMPVCMPEQIYKSSRKSLSNFLPIQLERIFIFLSFALADRVITSWSFGKFVDWLTSHPLAQKKLVITKTLVDALPTIGFFKNLRTVNKNSSPFQEGDFTLIYIGRLHREKLVDDLIKMMTLIKIRLNRTPLYRVKLNLVGDGPEKPHLKLLANELGVEEMIEFVGSVPNEDLPEYLLRAKIFISTLTGTSLREAALCGLPIIAYNADWIRGILKHEETALLVPLGDFEKMAHEVIRLISDEKLRNRLSHNIKELAWRLWSPQSIYESLCQVFKNDP
jgi:glycosyltransferase involved in cell wall biosynthesis